MPSDWLSVCLTLVGGIVGFLGLFVSVKPQWAMRHSNLLAGTFAILTLLVVSLGIIQTRRLGQASAGLAGSLERLRESSEEIARVQRLNTELQQRLLESNDTIRTLSQQNLDQLTGGSSYPIITPLPTLTEPNTFRLVMSIVGENTLWDVSYRVTEGRPPYKPTREELARLIAGQGWNTVGMLNPGQGRPLNDVIHPSVDGVSAWTINVTARNGSTVHFLEMRFNGDQNHWERQFTIRKGNSVLRTKPWHRFGR